MIPRSLCLCAVVFAVATSATVQADPAPGAAASPAKPSVLEPIREAQRRFNMGVTLYQEGDLRGSLAEFKAAYASDPVYRVLYNLGLVSRELNDWAGAHGYYSKYLRQGEDRVPAARRVQVEREVLELAQRVGRLEIEVRDGPAEVQVDDRMIEPVALDQPILVNPGRRRLRVTFPKQTPQIRTVDVASGDRKSFVFEGGPTSGARATLSSAPPPDRASDEDPPNWPLHARAKSTGVRATTYTWVATGVLLAGAAVTGYYARQASLQLQSDRSKYPANGTDLALDKNRLQMLATTADGLLAGGVLCALVSGYLTWWSTDDKEKRAIDVAETRPAPPRSVAATLPLGTLGVSYGGRF